MTVFVKFWSPDSNEDYLVPFSVDDFLVMMQHNDGNYDLDSIGYALHNANPEQADALFEEMNSRHMTLKEALTWYLTRANNPLIVEG